MTENKRTQVFISYSHADKIWLTRLRIALRLYVRENLLDVWDDTRIRPGTKWKDEIEKALASAKVAVLLVSMDFLASDFIATNELPPLLEAAEKDGLTILWIPISASAYKRTAIKDYQAVSDPARPLDSLPPHKRKKELVNICEIIHSAAAETNDTPAKTETPQEAAPNDNPPSKSQPQHQLVMRTISGPTHSLTKKRNRKLPTIPRSLITPRRRDPELTVEVEKMLLEMRRHAFLIHHWVEVLPEATSSLAADIERHSNAMVTTSHSLPKRIQSMIDLKLQGFLLETKSAVDARHPIRGGLARTLHPIAYTEFINVIAYVMGNGPPTPQIIFSDVHPTDECYAAIQDTCSRGLISGYADGTFRPTNNMTLGQFLKIVVTHRGFALDTTGGPNFDDVPPSSYAYSVIETAAKHNIIQGNEAGKLEPDQKVKLAEMCKIIIIAEGWPLRNPVLPTFSDVSTSHPFYLFIETAYRNRLVPGYPDGSFHPDEEVTRAQVCQAIHNAAMSNYKYLYK